MSIGYAQAGLLASITIAIGLAVHWRGGALPPECWPPSVSNARMVV
jgi:hypothetical protein